MNRSDIAFMSGTARCAGWFYLADVAQPAPCIVMGHGLAAVKEMRLDAYAERFVAQGYHVRAAAHRFAALGATICATDVNAAALQTLRDELGDRHTYAAVDVTDKDSVGRVLAEFAAKHHGGFDLLLNNAGVAFLGDFEAGRMSRATCSWADHSPSLDGAAPASTP